MSIQELKVKKGRKKLEIVQLIFEILNEEKEVTISRFIEAGLNNPNTIEYIIMINWIVDNGQKINVRKLGDRIKVISVEKV